MSKTTPFTVGKLIEKLKTFDPKTRVVVNGYEDGYRDLDPDISIIQIVLNVNDKWYYGPHEELNEFSSDKKSVKAILLE